MEKRFSVSKILLNGFFILFSLCFLLPFLLVVSVSFSSEASIEAVGYTLLPSEFSLEGYLYVFQNPQQIIDAYIVTAFTAFFGTLCALVVMSMVAYSLSRRDFAYRGGLTLFIFITMIFSGGLVPSYIINTQYLGLGNNILIYILPGLASAWHIVILRTFFQDLPVELVESAKLDGAREITILSRIIIPLSKPVLATVGLLILLGKWNDWNTSLIYITNQKLYTLQYLLQRILREVEFIQAMAKEMPTGISAAQIAGDLPTESMRFALAIVAAGPMLVVFPFFQKYFVSGLTVGAVKG